MVNLVVWRPNDTSGGNECVEAYEGLLENSCTFHIHTALENCRRTEIEALFAAACFQFAPRNRITDYFGLVPAPHVLTLCYSLFEPHENIHFAYLLSLQLGLPKNLYNRLRQQES